MGTGMRVLLFQDRGQNIVYFSRKWGKKAILYKRNNYEHFGVSSKIIKFKYIQVSHLFVNSFTKEGVACS
jgi:hypothetical protein